MFCKHLNIKGGLLIPNPTSQEANLMNTYKKKIHYSAEIHYLMRSHHFDACHFPEFSVQVKEQALI